MIKRVAAAVGYQPQALQGNAALLGGLMSVGRADQQRMALDEETKLAIARAVLAAMREPTEAMLRLDGGLTTEHGRGKRAAIWRAMIDAALTPPTNS